MLTLIAASTAMVVMVIKLASQVRRRSKYEPITDGDQFTKALKQLLPLAAFPMLFFIFEILVFILHVYTFQYSTPNEGIVISAYVCLSLEYGFGCNSYNPHLCGSDMWQETQTYQTSKCFGLSPIDYKACGNSKQCNPLFFSTT